MAGEVEQFASCADCGATIYPEHLEKRVAEHWEGKLLCPFCLREKRMGSAVGMTPPAIRPCMHRSAKRAAPSGSSPNERVQISGFFGLVFTSSTGEWTMVAPMERSCFAMARLDSKTSFGSPVAAMPMAEGRRFTPPRA